MLWPWEIISKLFSLNFTYRINFDFDHQKILDEYINAKNNPGLFPELHLPLEKDQETNTVFSHIKNDKDINVVPYQKEMEKKRSKDERYIVER